MPYSLGEIPLPFELDESYWKWVESLRKQDSSGKPDVPVLKYYEPEPLPVKPPTGDIPFEPLISPAPSKPSSTSGFPFPFPISLLDPHALDSWWEKWQLRDFPDVVYEALETQVKPIDPDLYLYMANAPRDLITLDTIVKSIISVGSYPHVRKVNAMKEAFYKGGQALSKLSPFFNVREEQISVPGTRMLWFGDSIDPEDPTAPSVPPELEQAEMERRKRWENAWLDYITKFKKRLPPELEKKIFVYFSCELPTRKVKPKISPRLRLPSGEYLEPVTVTGTILPVGPVAPQPEEPGAPIAGVVPVSEEKKDEKKDEKKKFPWWIVVVIGAVAMLFFMKK